MRDLDIWRRLESGAATTADLAAVAALPLSRRCAYVGGALPLVTHADPRMRAAALHVLAGARGVEGVRAIVNALADDDEAVRAAALAALRETARDAPLRFAHALFHARADVRRAALAESLPQPLAELATYLRADRESDDLADQRAQWPANSLALAFGLYADGHLSPRDLVQVCATNTPAALRHFIESGHKRAPDSVTAYLDAVIARGLAATGPLPGADLLDHLAGAIVVTAHDRRDLTNIHSAIVEARTQIVRRVAAALLSQLTRAAGTAELWGFCIALEPRLLAMPDLPVQHLDAMIDALRTTRAGRAPDELIKQLLALPIVEGDLALAAALVSRASAKRLRLLADLRGEPQIIASLLAADRGWREICALPQETPSLELEWLARVEAYDYKRYVRLSGICIRTFPSNRKQLFIEHMPRRHRPAVFLSALLASAGDTDERVLALCLVLAGRIDRGTLMVLLPEVLDRDASGRLALGLVRSVTESVLASAARDLSVRHVVRLVELIDKDPIPRHRELELEKVFRERGIAEVADWCAHVTSILTAPISETPVLVRTRRELTLTEERTIAGASGKALDTALAPALGGCVTGLVRALDRPRPAPHVWACVALLSCADRFEDVVRLLDMWSDPTEAFATAVDNAMSALAHAADLPPLARARLWRWERQLYSFLDWVEAIGHAFAALSIADRLRRRFARETLWRAVSEGLMLVRYRDLPRFLTHASIELAEYCAERIDEPIGRHAARMLVAFVEAGVVPVAAVRDRVLDRVAEADGETRSYVARLIRLEGVPEVQQVAPPPVNLIDDIRTSTDVEALAAWCLDPRPAVVQESALALVALGPDGQMRLAALLAAGGLLAPVPVLATIVLWDHPPALDAVRAITLRDDLEPSWQFHLSLALLHRGEPDALPRVLAAVRAPSTSWYFRRADWDALVKAADIVTVAIALADAPHHHAYQRSVNLLLSLTRPTPAVHEALVRFLEIDGERPLHLRMAAARYIARYFHDARALPLLVEEVCDAANAESHRALHDTPDASVDRLLRAVADAALIGGNAACSEARMWWVTDNLTRGLRVSSAALAETNLRIFEASSHAATRRQAAQRVLFDGEGLARVRRVAEVFAWGVRRGVELAGRMFKFHLTSSEKDFGHTRLDGNHIFVSPLPMLRGEQHGDDIVEGLVLHEIGHHVYHRSPEAQTLWKRAHTEGIGHFLNLIADEHLERNLRAVDPAYGDRLKRLGAYAFQHAPQEITIASLTGSLGAATAPALIAADLGVAYDEDSVRIRRGAILGELDRLGHPVARFSRALRMGLGNRAGDPLNAAALALCGKELRQLDMQGLYDLTKRLVDLFGGRVEIAKVFGGPEGLVFGERDDDVFGAGIDDDILQREIERILEPPGAKSHSRSSGGGRLAINVNPDTRFDKITKIVRVQGQPELHRKLVTEVARHSARLRSYLDELGLRWEPARARTQGRALDKTRLRALVTRNDPRILMARTPLRKTDLFVGTIVDCSGSMQVRDNIGRARRFAVLVSEAVRQLQGVEARFFGFTDSVIYDAGDKDDCHVTALTAGGGNNDAAALYHAATVALAAPQRAKVLIMVSDGLPTECSVAALRNLVTELTRKRGIVCAQVGVIQLTEICFPHYVLIDDDQLDVAVAKFGRMIADLARRSLAS